MKWANRKFTNELGREIRVEVADRIEGTTPVRITMTGPDSVDEGFCTRMEAEQLRDALVECLGGEEEDEEGAVIAMMCALHSNVPEIDRPMSRSDFSDEQWTRAEATYRSVRASKSSTPAPDGELGNSHA